MGNLTDAERPVPPRPLAYLLPKAIAAFIAHKCDRTMMLVPAWASTFHVGSEDVRTEFDRQMSAHSLKQHHNYEEMDK